MSTSFEHDKPKFQTQDTQNENDEIYPEGPLEYVDGRSSQTGFGKENIPAEAYDGPSLIDQNKNIIKNIPTWAKFSAGASAIGLLVFGGAEAYEAYQQKKIIDETTEQIKEAYGATDSLTIDEDGRGSVTLPDATGTTTIKAPASPTPTTTEAYIPPANTMSQMSAEEFASIDRLSQIEYGKEKLTTQRESSYKFLFGKSATIEQPSTNDTALDATSKVDKIISADMYTASLVGKRDADEGAKLLAVIIDPQVLNSYYTALSKSIGPGKDWLDNRGEINYGSGLLLLDSESGTVGVKYTKTNTADGGIAEYTVIQAGESSKGDPIYSVVKASAV